MLIDPRTLSAPERYKLLIGGIVPRPIAWVSTMSIEGRPNLAPFSFFAGVGSNPMTLLFCPANRADGSEKDTLRNARLTSEGGTGEFVVNVVPMRLAHQMAACAEELPFGESEFDMAGLATAPSSVVKAPRVKASPLAFECRTVQVVRTNESAPSAGNIVIGEVLAVHVDDAAISERNHIDPAALDAVGRMAGLTYCTTRGRFEIPWGRKALDANENPLR